MSRTSRQPGLVAHSSGFVASELDEIIDNSPIAMFLATTEDGILRANRAASEMTGLGVEEMLGRRLLHTAVHPDDVPSVTWVGDSVRAGKTTEVRHRLLTTTGEVRHIRGSITPVFKDGALRYGVAQYVDETELVVASHEMARQRELLATFAEAIAHDLRSPIAGVVGFADILQREEEPLAPYVAEIVGMMLDSAHEASRTIERTLRKALGSEAQSNVTADLIEVVERITKLLGPNLAATGGRISYVGGARFLLLDEAVLGEVLLNLCQNAVKYRGAEPPEIRVQVNMQLETLTVDDNGRGIAAELRRQIFDRGFQTGPDNDGHGLGLGRVRDLVEGMGGSIEACESDRGGTAMVMTLPGAFIQGDS